MEPDPNVQTIIASFSSLSSKQARQAAYETPYLERASVYLLISQPQILWHHGSARPG